MRFHSGGRLPTQTTEILVRELQGTVSVDHGELRRQPLKNFLAQLLRLAEELLILNKHPIQFNRLIRRQLMSQQHVADVHRIRQRRFFRQFFKRGRGIVVVHPFILTLRSATSQQGLRVSLGQVHYSSRIGDNRPFNERHRPSALWHPSPERLVSHRPNLYAREHNPIDSPRLRILSIPNWLISRKMAEMSHTTFLLPASSNYVGASEKGN